MSKEVLEASTADQQEISKTPEKEQVNNIYHILTRREIRREYPPAEKEIIEAISRSLENNEPIELVIVWGGFKNTEQGRADEADESTFKSLNNTADKIRELGVNVNLILYFGDFHAISPYYGRGAENNKKSLTYEQDIEKLAKDNNFEDLRPMSSSLYGISRKELERELLNPDIEPKLCYTTDPEIKERFLKDGRDFWEKASSNVKQEIMKAAEKYASKELIEKEGLEKLAMLYAGSRLFEKIGLEGSHKKGIFLNFGRPVYPLVPEKSIYIFSCKKGTSEQPWFIDAEKKFNKPDNN